MEKVVITGLGTVNALGHSLPETWSRIVEGIAGIGPITLFDASAFEVSLACEVRGFDPQSVLPRKEARRRDRSQLFATASAQQALAQSGLRADQSDPGRIGVFMSCSVGGMASLQEVFDRIAAGTPRRVSPLSSTMFMANGASGMIAIDHGFTGPAHSVNSACASGADGIGSAWLMIRAGVLDAAVAGGTDAPITSVGVGSLDRSGAMSRRTIDDAPCPQPFDLDRDGFVMGEGAAALVLESESHARARGAEILAELAGYGSTADAFHITAPSKNGEGAALAMRSALSAAGEETVDYINAHGTGTRLNDRTETKAIKRVFGEPAYRVPVSSTKSMTGHMIGATGALEAALCVAALRDQVAPPTINYHTPDPDCDLDYVPNQARRLTMSVVMSNSFGFGGHNAVLVVRKY